MLRALEYPHWLIFAGILLIAFGLIGLTFRRNKDARVRAER